jgi:hypothetical protein
MYKDKRVGDNLIKRVISESRTSEELTWHRDENDRHVRVVMGEGWSFQSDNRVPESIRPGDIINIKAGEWHRVIPGKGDLTIMIKESKGADKKKPNKGDKKPDDLLIDLIREMSGEPAEIDLQGDEDVSQFQDSGISDEEGKILVSEDDLLEALILLRNIVTEEKKKSDHKPGYKAPEGSARDRKLDAAKAAYDRGDVQTAIRIRDEMEKQAREKPGYKTRKSKYTDETKQPVDYPPVMSEMDDIESQDEDDMYEGLGSKTREALKKKAESSNAPLGALSTVYKKGLGAFYSSGSRPGMTSHQWAMARVNSFLKGGKARQVDAAQWKQVQKHRKHHKKGD